VVSCPGCHINDKWLDGYMMSILNPLRLSIKSACRPTGVFHCMRIGYLAASLDQKTMKMSGPRGLLQIPLRVSAESRNVGVRQDIL
jgi:hypothetical protein